MTNDKLYEEYFKKATSIKNPRSLPEDKVDEMLNDLLKCLPNNGFLYKYRRIDVEASKFAETFEPLKEGYLYLPSASQMNDKIDTTFSYNPAITDEDVDKYYRDNMLKIALKNLREKRIDGGRITEKILLMHLKNYNPLEIANAITLKRMSLSQKISYVKNVIKNIEQFCKREDLINNFKRNFNKMPFNIQRDTTIYSFSSTYKQDSMWAYYGGDNNGYCIVYDFKKSLRASLEAKRLLISMGKIKYSNNKKPLDFLKILDDVYAVDQTQEQFSRSNQEIYKCLLVKNKSWSHEKEWRLVQNNETHRINADLVAGLIIDEDILSGFKTKQLIELALDREWFIKIRHLNKKMLRFEYVMYQRFLKQQNYSDN